MDIKKINKQKTISPVSPSWRSFSNIKQQKLPESLSETSAAGKDFNLISSSERKKVRKRRYFRMLKAGLFFLIVIATFALAFGCFFIYKINSTEKKINTSATHEISLIKTFSDLATHNYPELKSSQGRINVLLLGIAGEKKPGQNLTDTIMILSIDTKSNRVALLSIPRDLYVKIPDMNIGTKINSVYQIGINTDGKDIGKETNLIEKTVEDIASLKINYHIVLNFDGFENIIDALGGVNIMNESDIYDPRYPGANYSYETFELKKGFYNLDGKTALKYVRERHNDLEGDFGRAKRQQQVMQAAKNKIFSAKTLFDVFRLNKIFDALGNNIKTNIEPRELGSFFELSKKLDTQNINNVVVDAWNKESFLKVAHIEMGNANAFVLVPKIGNYSEIQDTAQNIFNLNEIKRRKDEIQKENARILILNLSGDASLSSKVKKVLTEHLDYKNMDEVLPKDKTTIDDAFIYDLSGKSKPFTLDELIKTLSASLSDYNQNYESYADDFSAKGRFASGEHPDVIIGLGKDLIQKYNIKEGTIEDWQKSQD
jgi:polyisoprenyl-teichoic acid--peptidoglycan teichoic acid transferase